MEKKLLFLFLFFLLIAAVFGASAYFQTVFFEFTDVLAVYEGEHFYLGALVFIGLAALSVMLGPFSSVPLVPSAILIWGVPQALIMLLFGWLTGNTIAFTIGRFLGYPLVAKIVGQKKLNSWLAALKPRLKFGVLLLFRIATPSETGYVFGLLKYNFRNYLLLTFIAELPFAIIAVYASEAFATAGWGSFASLVVSWFLIILIAFYVFRKLFLAAK